MVQEPQLTISAINKNADDLTDSIKYYELQENHKKNILIGMD